MSDLRYRRTQYARNVDMPVRLVRTAPVIAPAVYPPSPPRTRLVWFLQRIDWALNRLNAASYVALKRSVSLIDTLTIFLLASLSGLTATLIHYTWMVSASGFVELLEMLA